jgi:hypothetical protein
MKSIQKLKMPSPALAYPWVHASSVDVVGANISRFENAFSNLLVLIKKHINFYQKGFPQ